MKKFIVTLMLLFALPANADVLLKNMVGQINKVNPSYQPITNFQVEGKAYVVSSKAFEGKDIISLYLYDTRRADANPEVADAAAIFLRDSRGNVRLYTLVFGEAQDIIKQEIVLIFQLVNKGK